MGRSGSGSGGKDTKVQIVRIEGIHLDGTEREALLGDDTGVRERKRVDLRREDNNRCGSTVNKANVFFDKDCIPNPAEDESHPIIRDKDYAMRLNR